MSENTEVKPSDEFDGSVPVMPAVDDADEVTIYPADGEASATAVALIEAAEKLGHDASVVRTSDGGFIVPADVADSAKLDKGTEKVSNASARGQADNTVVGNAGKLTGGQPGEGYTNPADKTPAKKAAPRKAAAKKAAPAKKS
jgi:hypothetical protein